MTLAEIAVALAGFTGIVGVLGRRGEATSGAISWLRLRTMLEIALRNAAFALLPLPFLEFPLAEPLIWRIGSGAYLVTLLVYVLVQRRRDHASAVPTLTGPLLILLPISVLACVANVLGLSGPYAFSFYLLSLLLGLFTGGMLFLSVAATIFGEQGT
jgi:hypothetical protein